MFIIKLLEVAVRELFGITLLARLRVPKQKVNIGVQRASRPLNDYFDE
jgi:hypothetical protein